MCCDAATYTWAAFQQKPELSSQSLLEDQHELAAPGRLLGAALPAGWACTGSSEGLGGEWGLEGGLDGGLELG